MFLEAWFTLHVAQCVSCIKDIDIVLPIFPPVAFFPFTSPFLSGQSTRAGIVHDLQAVVYHFGLQRFPRSQLSEIIRKLKKKAFAKCDRLVFLSKAMADEAVTAYELPPRQMFHPLSFCSEHFEGKHQWQSLPAVYAWAPVVYSGALGEKQNPFELFQFFRALTNRSSGICCHIFSRGLIFDELSAQNQRDPAALVYLHDLVAESDLPALYAHSTVQIVPQKLGSSAGAFPSKIPNLFAAGVPVFAVCDQQSELAHILGESGMGTSAATWDLGVLLDKFHVFLNSINSHARNERQAMAQDYVKLKFNIDDLVATIVS